MTLFLASASPRRAELLQQIGVPFTIEVGQVDEHQLPAESPMQYVERLARNKAMSLAKPNDVCVLGADTVVVLDGRVLGKPVDRADAIATLQALSGRAHQVMTGVAVCQGEHVESCVVTAEVNFAALSLAQIERYWDSGEPADKAGSYAIQGWGAVFVTHLEGSYSAVVGLPLHETAAMLARFGIDSWQVVRR